MNSESKPTVVLVHGAFADASGWTGVIKKLQRDGYTALAPANPLRSLHGDAEYVRAVLATIEGPIVLVGHSYGGAVITNAATDVENVVSLVYICGFALDEGEPVLQALGLGGGSAALGEHTLVRPYPGAGEGDADGYIDPAYFKELFCDDLSDEDAAAMAAAQRPAALNTLGTLSGVPAWKTIPSWFLIGADDRTIPPEAHRAMAERAGGIAVEIESSHVAMISHPDAVAKLIVDAAKNAVPA
ncbi:alpha/beta hydrolase [Conyzicola nivalis]|uniref:Alpha/beta hydrolase n=1 Tax=Conyzicola nivalis TaxID=1477021 RepID=A0A916SI54_9MICO|nr:alpha/beta hydrolase [Conyzicola nivalis]GGB00244.1 alpha/beta hydrolase [Conyzicola nivalis]